jgi:tRNA pseudouridine55 synthase
VSINGFIPLNKPPGISSQQAVSRVKRITGCKKAGHTGTLDPLATGLLLVAVGRATRLCQYFLEGDKGYRAEIQFGAATDTGDREGRVIGTAQNFSFSSEQIAAVLAQFQGLIDQVPPAASALKIDGQRAFNLFRQGQTPEMPVRQVYIKSIAMLQDTGVDDANPILRIDVLCSKGTYIRSLAGDIGVALGCPAHLAALTRTQISQISLSQAATFADLERNYSPWLLDMAIAVDKLPKLQVGGENRQFFLQGRQLAANGYEGEVAVFSGSSLLGIARADNNIIKPVKVLVQEQET